MYIIITTAFCFWKPAKRSNQTQKVSLLLCEKNAIALLNAFFFLLKLYWLAVVKREVYWLVFLKLISCILYAISI